MKATMRNRLLSCFSVLAGAGLLLGAAGCITVDGERRAIEPYRGLSAAQRTALRQAREALAADRYAQAEAAARQVIDSVGWLPEDNSAPPVSSPGLSMAYMLLALAQDGQKKTAEAELSFAAALRANMDNHVARFNLGNHYARLGRHREAAVQFGEALRLSPRNRAAQLNLAIALANCRRYSKAEATVRRLLARDQRNADAHNVLGTILLDQGMVRDALAEFKAAIALAPMRAEFHLNLARSCELAERNPDAIDEYRRFLELAPGDDPDRSQVQERLRKLGSRQ